MKPLPILILLGPSSSGKTSISLTLARKFPIEIVSIDSVMVYRNMDIGSAKPSPQDLLSIPHHLINISDPEDTYSVAQFVKDTNNAIKAITARKRLPLLVGGTMLYYKALINPLTPLPSANPEVRNRLNIEAIKFGWSTLYTRLANIDPLTAKKISPTDTQRIQRALEVFELTGKPISVLHKIFTTPKLKQYLFKTITLEPTNRDWLHERIIIRFNNMLKIGFLEEMMLLYKSGTLHCNMPSMKAVGYRQAWSYLDGKYDFQTFYKQVILATKKLCKHQLTWQKKIQSHVILNCQEPNLVNQIYEIASKFWEKYTN